MKGYMGKILRVNLSNGKITPEDFDENFAREWMGGVGMATKVLYDEVPQGLDPLSEKNKILFFTGPLTATGYPGASRHQVLTQSPLTGLWLSSSSSGHWGVRLKGSGYDGLIVEGASPRPVILDISDEGVQILDASDLWGQDTLKTHELIKERQAGREASICCIGPGGERKVKFACIMNDEGRFAGRGGAGAVMGSKNLKAIIVSGKRRPRLEEEARFKDLVKSVVRDINSSLIAVGYRTFGTTATIDNNALTGDVPVKNFTIGAWEEGCRALGGIHFTQKYFRKRHPTCYACPVQCSKWIQIEKGPHPLEGPSPEYESIAALGTNCLSHNLEAVCRANDLCNRYGIDTISTGVTISFLMEAFEKELISSRDLNGLKPVWGDAEAILQLVRMIGEEEGIGRLMGEGVKKMAQTIGKGSEAFAVHVKGLEAPMHDPRAYFSWAPTYATSPRGACHLHGPAMMFDIGLTMIEGGINEFSMRFDNFNKGLSAKVAQDMGNVLESAVLCYFTVFPVIFLGILSRVSDALQLATGESYTVQELYRLGERVSNLQRAFNNRCGTRAEEDTLPPRLLEPFREGEAKGKVPDIAAHLKDYYRVRGWTTDGKPSQETLEKLGLGWVIPDLYSS